MTPPRRRKSTRTWTPCGSSSAAPSSSSCRRCGHTKHEPPPHHCLRPHRIAGTHKSKRTLCTRRTGLRHPRGWLHLGEERRQHHVQERHGRLGRRHLLLVARVTTTNTHTHTRTRQQAHASNTPTTLQLRFRLWQRRRRALHRHGQLRAIGGGRHLIPQLLLPVGIRRHGRHHRRRFCR